MAYKFIHKNGFIPYETCLPYEACSSESKEGNCQSKNWTCSAINTCRTCPTFGKPCKPIHYFPNATISNYGRLHGWKQMMKEIYNSGPIACGVNANAILKYKGGIINDDNSSKVVDHEVSVVGWGKDKDDYLYWIVRNSWGEYWGEMGYFKIRMGLNQLGIESDCSWAKVGQYTDTNIPCNENGENC